MNKIKLLKTRMGEEILAETETTDLGKNQFSTILMKNPVAIIVVPPAPGAPQKQSLAFVPWLQFSKDETVEVVSDHIVTIAEPIDQLVQKYREMFSSLTLPQTQLILP
jgi:hypothetical protein